MMVPSTNGKRVYVRIGMENAVLSGWGKLNHTDIDGLANITLDSGQTGWFASKEYDFEDDLRVEGRALLHAV